MAKNAERNRSTAGRVFRKILLVFLVLFILAAAAAGIWFYNNYGKELLSLKAEAGIIAAKSSRDDFANAETSICYYSDGSVMQILAGEKNVYYLPYNSIPKHAVNAMLAVEDRKFFSHKGYDVYAIARAAKAYIENDGRIKQGGSTITQQLARLTYLTNEKTVERKVKEIFLAAALERKYSKYDILEFYLNNVYFAGGYYGLQSASKGYFGVTAGELSLSQIAFLCGIPNSPSSYNPRTNFENTLERRDSVLKQMHDNGFIGEDEYKEALSEKITLVTTETETNNYEATYTYKCAIQALMQAEGFLTRYTFEDKEDEALYNELYYDEYYRMQKSLYAKGYRIYTSINPVKQEKLQVAIDNELADYTETNDEGIFALQSSGVCIDNDTGFVVAIVGGRAQDSVGYTLNRAYQSPRQPGSAIKPLIVYTPVFERGYYPDTMVVDEKFDGGPRNSEGVYSGEITVRYAVQVSKNTIAWKLFEELGIDRGLGYLRKMNFAHIVDNDRYPAASLGGLTYGATAVEMASAYAALENDGVYRTPTCILRITDTDGNAIIDNTTTVTLATNTKETKRVYEKNASRMMTDVMTTVMEEGTGHKVSLESFTCAGKTGTTNDQKDGWFVGYTRYYTTGIWVGYDMPRAMEDLRGNTYPGRIWQSFMQDIHEGLEDKAFETFIDNRPPERPKADENEESEEDSELENPDTEDGNTGETTEMVTDGDITELTDTEEIMDPDREQWLENLRELLDTDGDGVIDVYPYGWIDTDNDGIPDSYPIGWTDNDGDGIPDGYDPALPDTDEDGIPDLYEEEEIIWVKPGEGYDWVNRDNEDIVWVDPRDNRSPEEQ